MNHKHNVSFCFCVLVLFIAWTSGVRAESVTKTYSFTSVAWEAVDEHGDAAHWVSGQDGGGAGPTQGIRISSTNSGANATSPQAFSNVTRIVVTYNTNKSQGAGQVRLQIGNNAAISHNVAYSKGSGKNAIDGTSANYTTTFDYATPQSGAVLMTITCTTNSVWIKSIAITYEDDGNAPQADEDPNDENPQEGEGTDDNTSPNNDTPNNDTPQEQEQPGGSENDEVEDGVFDFSLGNYQSGMVATNITSGIDVSPKTWVAGNVTMVTEGRVLWFGSENTTTTLRLYKQTDKSDPHSSLTVSVPTGYLITQMEITGGDRLVASVKKADGTGRKSGSTWTGAAKSVTLTHDEATGGITLSRLAVTYLASPQQVTLGSSHYITYCTPAAMSFGGVAAYVVSEVGDDYVTLSEVTEAPAQTPVILNASAGIHELTVKASASAVDQNFLKVSDGTIVGDGTNYYALAADENGTVGFHVVAADVAIPAGKCYLDTGGLSAKARLNMEVPEANGIDLVKAPASSSADAFYYSLSGQRVVNPSRGLYIRQGKKIWVK